MGANSIISAFLLAVLILMTASPAIFLLCISDTIWKKAVSVGLFVVSLTGMLGLKAYYDANPTQVTHQTNNLYNYGENVE